MTTRFRKITAKELEAITLSYRDLLPGWVQIDRHILTRGGGPVLHCVWFEALSSGSYRSRSCLRILTAPGATMLSQVLRQVLSIGPGEHERLKERVVAAMRREFVPTMTKPLDPDKALKLCEQKAIPRSPEAYALASLNAYLGKRKRALYWCSRFSELVEELGHGWQDWDRERRAFLDSLEAWIDEGTERQYLEAVIEEERSKWIRV